jgi:hypothetical protein
MTMFRVVLSIAALALMTSGAFAQTSAQTDAPDAKAARVSIPVSQLRFYCLSNGDLFSVGAITCLARDRWGVCKWSDQGSIPAVPRGRAYWVNSTAPRGACPG